MSFFSTPVAYASNVDTFIGNVNRLIVNPLIGMMFAVALVYFLYGVYQFISNAENEEMRTAGKQHMVWGIVGLTIMIGVFSIIRLALNTFNVKGINAEKGEVELNDYNPHYPQFGSPNK